MVDMAIWSNFERLVIVDECRAIAFFQAQESRDSRKFPVSGEEAHRRRNFNWDLKVPKKKFSKITENR